MDTMLREDVTGEGTGSRSSSVRALSELSIRDAAHLGDEARDVARLIEAGMPMAPGFLVRLGSHGAERLEAAVTDVLATGGVARLRPFFPSRSAAKRFERTTGPVADVRSEEEGAERVAQLLSGLRAPDVTAALGGSLGGMHVRVLGCDAEPAGRAASMDPVTGDPDTVAVWTRETAAARFTVDRRSMRVTLAGEGLEDDAAQEIADLVDRVQLVLGRPIELEWCTFEGRFLVVAFRPLVVEPTFGEGNWRRLRLMAEDEGTVAPLSIDCLDEALRPDDVPPHEHHVRRVFARPYRRRATPVRRLRPGADPVHIARAGVRAVQVARDVAAPLGAVRRFRGELGPRLAEIDRVDLAQLDDPALVAELHRRRELVIECLVLLDRGRQATLTVLITLEAVVGAMPRESFLALAVPQRVRRRRRVDEKLEKLASRIEDEMGHLVPRSRLSDSLGRKWDELRRSLVNVRRLGLDARPDGIGSSHANFVEAMRHAMAHDEEVRERARPFGRSREAIAASLVALAGRVAYSKGHAAEALASAMLRLRRAACEAGRRLSSAGVLDGPEDALYLHMAELEEALSGEPGAYAARVRLRREDDARWARFSSPRRIRGRR